jgi:hypothetical protein
MSPRYRVLNRLAVHARDEPRREVSSPGLIAAHGKDGVPLTRRL